MDSSGQNSNPTPPTPQSNIDDLVKELSRPQSMPPAPSNPAPAGAIPPSSSMPPRPVMPSPAPMPARPVMPAPAPKPAAPMPNPAPSVIPAPMPQSYQSNIRTMADDLASLKSGKQPQGTTLPHMTSQPMPAKPAPASSPSSPSPAPMPARPVMPAPAPVRPVMPQRPSAAPAPIPAQPVRPSFPTAPSAAPAPKTPASSQFYTPETAKTGGNGRSLIFIGIGAAVIVFGVMYWFFFIRQPDTAVVEVPTQTLTPVPSATPLPPIATLFSGTAGTITLTPNTDPAQTFAAGLKTIVVTPGQLGVLTVTDAASGQSLMPFGLFDRLLVAYPVELKPASGSDDGVILAYGQQEAFNAKGQPVTNPPASDRVAFITKVTDLAAVSLRNWEPTMSDNLASLFNITKTKNTGPFSDAFYQGTSVRFKNFAYPDMAIDYALVPYDGSSYLVMASSREAMFAVINVLNPPGK